MINFFDPETYKSFVTRIESLTSGHQAQWGKMSVDQMIQHCIKPLKMAMGEVEVQDTALGYRLVKLILGPVAKWFMTRTNQPMGKNMPTNPDFIVSDHPAFEKVKIELLSEIQRLFHGGLVGITKNPHPFFGKMSPNQWSVLMAKHLDHHLRQFGG